MFRSAVMSAVVLLAACTSATTLQPPASTLTDPPPSDGPALMTVSIHVEGWTAERDNPEVFDRHAAIILDTARAVADGGGIFWFELSTAFALAPGARAVVDELLALGHAVEVHADVGGQGTPNLAVLTEQLAAKRRQVADLGVDPVQVSGICADGPFVEAAIAAGFTTTTGSVEYCLVAVDPAVQPAGFDAATCTSPAQCHGPPPFDLATRATPWWVDATATWPVPDPSGRLLMMVGESGTSVPCMVEGWPREDPCTADDADIAEFARRAAEYAGLDAATHGGTCCVLSTSWSIGSAPPDGFTANLVASVAPLVADGAIAWATPADVIASAR